MRGREKARFRTRVWVIGLAVLAALLALGIASPAVAKKKKKEEDDTGCQREGRGAVLFRQHGFYIRQLHR